MLPEEGQRIARVIFGAVGTIAEGMPTEVRRGLRDAGVSPWLAQDIGDVLSLGQNLLLFAGQAGKVAKGVKGAQFVSNASGRIGYAEKVAVQSKNILASMDLFQSQARLITLKGVPNAGGYIRSFVTTKDEVYYRVYSAKPQGAFLTKIPPKNQVLAKEGLALPPSNEATYIQEVLVPAGTRLQRSRALPAYDRRGGMEQFFLIDEIPPINFMKGKVFK